MQIESLALFLAIAESGSLTKAAQKFYISPQGASASIKSLERQLNTILFNRSENGMRLTEHGKAVEEDVRKIILAYRRLQVTAALQSEGGRMTDCMEIVASPFVVQTFSTLLEQFGAFVSRDARIDIIERGMFDIAFDYPHLKKKTLYVIDLPYDMGIIDDCVPKRFFNDVLDEGKGIFKPFLLSEFMLRCSEDSGFAKRSSVSWQELSRRQIASHNDPFLLKMIEHHLAGVDDGEIGMKVTNVDLLDTAVAQHHMVGLFATFPIVYRQSNQQRRVGVAVPLDSRAAFVTGVLAPEGSLDGDAFFAFMKRYLTQTYPTYMKKNDPHSFFEYNRERIRTKR